MSKLFKAPAPPPIAPPAVMPTMNDEATRTRKKQAIASAQQRGGRASTILTQDSEDKLG